jgi:hypothetical protein
VRWEELSREAAEHEIAGLPDTALDTWASFVEAPEIVTPTVEQVTGKTARRFGEWARNYAEAFR